MLRQGTTESFVTPETHFINSTRLIKVLGPGELQDQRSSSHANAITTSGSPKSVPTQASLPEDSGCRKG